MRQDLLQRQKHIRKFHQSIEKYQQSPTTKKAFIKATMELYHAIQYKFKKSQINNNYVFPKNTSFSDDQYDSDVQVFDLKTQNDFLSQDLSIAEQAQSNTVYVSEKTVLMQEKCLSFSKQKNDGKSKLKIKVIKKKNNFDTCEVGSKLERLKTQHIQTNFSTASYKYENQSKNQNDSIQGKTWLLQPSTEVNHLRKKLKIATRIQHQPAALSPAYANLTMKTEYSYCNKRKQGKQNQRSTLNPHGTQKYYLTHSSSKKIQPFRYKLHINVKSTKNKTKQIKQNIENSVENCKKKVSHKSFENLKSIKLGHNKSNEKIKTIRGLHA